MCGIIGYKGNRNGVEIALNGLKKLEYRGYDSWGISTVDMKGAHVFKKIGKIGSININQVNLPKSNIAIGHTRWATHGNVTEKNAHPHFSETKRIIVVHNGIVENYQKLREGLRKEGYKFQTDTDTEVIAQLFEKNLKKYDLRKALQKTFLSLEGRNAIVVLDSKSKSLMGVRKGSPLVMGIKENEYFIASDVPAFLDYTNDVIFLEDYEAAIINLNIEYFNLKSNKKILKKPVKITWTLEQAKKEPYPHFMLKEILEQPETIRLATMQDEEELNAVAKKIKEAYGSFLIGCGTASYAALAGSYFFSKISKKHINYIVGSEFPSHQYFLTDKSLIIAISQSGETADTLEAVEVAKKKNAKIIGIVNVMGSSLMRYADYPLMTNAGPEISVCSTKAFTSQLSLLLLLAYGINNELGNGKKLLLKASEELKKSLDTNYIENIKRLAERIIKEKSEHIYLIGRGFNYPIALEAALKIKEVSYIHAEGFAAGELKHGVIALIGKGTHCIAIVANDEEKSAVINGAIELKSRGAYVIGIAPENNPIFDYWIKVPDLGNASPIANVIPAQLLAYYLAVGLGCDPDKPRNLAKSVTVK